MWRSACRRLLPSLSRASHPSPPLRVPLHQLLPPPPPPLFHRSFSAEVQKSDQVKVVVDVSEDDGKVTEADDDLGIATGVELQELLAERQGKKLFDLDAPRGPFGTKESPAIIQSLYDERIVGCSGGVGEDEHDVVWFKLKKGELYECTVCTQIFQLEVIGPGGPPGGHHH